MGREEDESGSAGALKIGGLTVSVAMLAACAGHDGSTVPAAGAPVLGNRKGAAATFTIKIPKKSGRHRLRRSEYISASTKSMTVTIVPSAGGAASSVRRST